MFTTQWRHTCLEPIISTFFPLNSRAPLKSCECKTLPWNSCNPSKFGTFGTEKCPFHWFQKAKQKWHKMCTEKKTLNICDNDMREFFSAFRFLRVISRCDFETLTVFIECHASDHSIVLHYVTAKVFQSLICSADDIIPVCRQNYTFVLLLLCFRQLQTNKKQKKCLKRFARWVRANCFAKVFIPCIISELISFFWSIRPQIVVHWVVHMWVKCVPSVHCQ